jgi:(heptosyl)LPS beta-1,4-glucosyltransferase
MISVAIAYLSEEEKKLEGCLASIKNFADEVAVIQIGKDIPFTPYVETIRNKMIERCKGDWVLVLDPDERIPESLALKLKEVAKEGIYEAVNIPRKNIFFGKWIRHTNWWPDRHVRFFKKEKVFWNDKIHLYPKITGRELGLPAKEKYAIEHYGYDTVSEFLERQNRYSSVEAKNRLDSGEKYSLCNLIWWPTREFLARYIKHLGFLDGFDGFMLTYLMVVYKTSVVVKMREGRK